MKVPSRCEVIFFKAWMDLEVASGLEIYFFKARMDLEVASTGEIFFSKHKSIWKLLVGVRFYFSKHEWIWKLPVGVRFFQSTNVFESCFHVQSILRLQVMWGQDWLVVVSEPYIICAHNCHCRQYKSIAYLFFFPWLAFCSSKMCLVLPRDLDLPFARPRCV